MPIQLDKKRKRLEKSWLEENWRVKIEANSSKIALIFLSFNSINFYFSKVGVYGNNHDTFNVNRIENPDIGIADINKMNKIDKTKDPDTSTAGADGADGVEDSDTSIVGTNGAKNPDICIADAKGVENLNIGIADREKDQW